MQADFTSSAPHLFPARKYDRDLKDWGTIATMIEGRSHTSGVVISCNADGSSETGIWICTPGFWDCEGLSDTCPFWMAATRVHGQVSDEPQGRKPRAAELGWRGGLWG